MANVSHATLTGSDLHEPKGADSAAIDTVYVATGGGSGAWQKIEPDQIDTSFKNVNKGVVTGYFADICTASSIYIVLPAACTVTAVYSVIHGAVGTADTVLTVKNNGGTSMTSGTITVAFSGSAAGDVDSCTPSANNTFTAGQKIRIDSDGAGSNVVPAHISVLYTWT